MLPNIGVVNRPLAARLAQYSAPEPNSGCFLWTGALDRSGYGRVGGRLAHRAAYELAKGPIPQGLTLDHLCRVRCCVNPDHLEAVTMRENTMRGDAITAANARKTHCLRGHEFTPENTYYTAAGRNCLICRRQCATLHQQQFTLAEKAEYRRAYRVANRERVREYNREYARKRRALGATSKGG